MASRIANQAFLLLCSNTSDSVIKSYQDIFHSTKTIGDCFILYHQKTKGLPKQIKKVNHVAFTDEVVTRLNYFPIGFNLVPGNNHFPLLEFFLKNPHYDYYWCIEDDVRFSGNWNVFFNAFSSIQKDFITSHIQTSNQLPGWYWWASLAHPYTVIPFEKRIRSFNPIYRISGKALEYIHRSLLDHWCGHHEVLLPTLLHHGGFKLMDFGGDGQFVPRRFKNKFYTGNPPRSDGTMRWRPIFRTIGLEKDKLYHPVK